MGPLVTHEAYIGAIRVLAAARVQDLAKQSRLMEAKLVYGLGTRTGARGLTAYGAWQNGQSHDAIEVCAAQEESDVQIAGTTIHELGHCLAGPGTGHGPAWKAACKVLGLVKPIAGGQAYTPEAFQDDLWAAIQALPVPTDGKPVLRATQGQRGPSRPTLKVKAALATCSQGQGVKGGTSRGPGSGSRLRLWVCSCPQPVKLRVASDDLDATCNRCAYVFKREEA